MKQFTAALTVVLCLFNCYGQEQSPTVSPATQVKATSVEGAKKGDVPSPDTVKWTEKVQAYTSILSVSITAIGFSLVVFQLYQAKKSLSGSTHNAVYTQQLTVNEVFINNPEFRKYFYDNIECLPDDKDRSTLLPITDMVADFFEHVTQQRSNLPEPIWIAWVRYMTYAYQHSPILREHFDKNESWYDDEFILLIKGLGSAKVQRSLLSRLLKRNR